MPFVFEVSEVRASDLASPWYPLVLSGVFGFVFQQDAFKQYVFLMLQGSSNLIWTSVFFFNCYILSSALSNLTCFDDFEVEKSVREVTAFLNCYYFLFLNW